MKPDLTCLQSKEEQVKTRSWSIPCARFSFQETGKLMVMFILLTFARAIAGEALLPLFWLRV
jgi:hypothetical protein